MVKGTGIGEDGGKGKGLMVSTVDSLGAARDFKGLGVGVNQGVRFGMLRQASS